MKTIRISGIDTLQKGRAAALSPAVRRFLRYVQIDTQSDPKSSATPSTERQKGLARLLLREMREAGISNSAMDTNGYVYAKLPARPASHNVRLGLLAHMDTSPDEPGAARPLVHFDYDGTQISLPAGGGIRLDPSERPELLRHIGDHIITGDGSSLLGSDDKAGVAVLMQLAEDLLDADAPRPEVQICFTVDEEIGRGVDHLDSQWFNPDVAYTIDGGGMASIYAETFNAAEASVDIKGVMVHPGYAKGIMVNALRIAGQLIAQLPVDEAPETTSGRHGYIHPHGMGVSSPSHAHLKVILRDFTEDGIADKKRLLTALVQEIAMNNPGAELSLEIRDQYANMRTHIEKSDPRVISFAHAAAHEMGIELEEKLVRGGTDGARLSEQGIPTPNIFNGGHDFHSRFEWNTAGSIDKSLEYVKTLVAYWGIHG